MNAVIKRVKVSPAELALCGGDGSLTASSRDEMAATEKAEINILNAYLPQKLSADEVTNLVKSAIAEVGATSKKDMGIVMKLVNAKAAGRVDGRTLSAEVQKHLSA